MPHTKRIYLDNAATSWPKPPGVVEAIELFYRDAGGSAGRGAHSASHQSDSIVGACRTALRQLVHAQVDDHLVFAHNGTDALNMAIHGILRAGDHAVASTLEHNSVLRPLNTNAEQRQVSITVVPSHADGAVDPEQFRAALRPETRLACLTHASNVTGVIQPISEVGRICREYGVPFLVDAAQTAGHIPIDVREIQCDLLASAGHKGLLGPLGTGFLYVSSRIANQVFPYRQGGTGTESQSDRQPSAFPSRLESGNLNVGAIAGLLAGIEFRSKSDTTRIASNEVAMVDLLDARLAERDDIIILNRDSRDRIGIRSLIFRGHDVHDVAAILDSAFGIQVRAGLHCAPHAAARSASADPIPTLRISPGWNTKPDEIELAADAIIDILD